MFFNSVPIILINRCTRSSPYSSSNVSIPQPYDLGTENTTPWAREKLFQIINHRYNGRLPTVITSNRRPEEIEPRIFSRMSDRAICDEFIIMDGDDYRRIPLTQRRKGQRPPRKA